jgi:fido (protein-threonine AMPylation protein)
MRKLLKTDPASACLHKRIFDATFDWSGKVRFASLCAGGVTGVVGVLLLDGTKEATESRESNVGFNTIRSFDAELPLIIEISKLDA